MFPRVLYVGHDDTDVELTRLHFQRRAPHISLEMAATGADALRRFADGAGPSRYDVILLDSRLPDLNGLELLRELRRDPAFNIPVVVVAGQDDEEAALSASRLGAAAHVVREPGYLHQLPATLENACYRAELIRSQAALTNSEERLRRAQGAARVGTWEWNLESGESYWSDGIYELLGLSHGDGRANVEDFVRFIHPEDRLPIVNAVESAINDGQDYYGEFRAIRHDGSIIWLSSKGRLIRDASGAAERLIGVNIDITERKLAELALRESEKLFRAAFDHAMNGMALVALDGRFLQVNRSVRSLFGYSEQELLATDFQFLTHPQDLDVSLAYIRRTLAGETDTFQLEKRYRHKSGRTVWALLSVSLLRDGDGQPQYFIGQLQDVTERKRAELRFNVELAVSRVLSEEASLAAAAPRLLQAMCEPLDCEFGEIWVPDRDTGRLTLLDCWSQTSSESVELVSASRQFTFDPGVGFPGRIWKSQEPEWIANLADNSEFVRSELFRGMGFTCGFGFPALVGHRVAAVILFFCHEVRQPDQELLKMTLGIGDQIGQFTERKQAEEALRLSEDKFSKAFRSSPDAFAISRQSDGMILEVNDRWVDMFDYTHGEAVWRTASSLHIYVDFSDRAKLLSLVREQGFARDVEMDVRRKSGEIRNATASAEQIMIRDEPCLLLMLRDITDRKQMEHALRQREEALRDSHARIEDLAGRLIVAQEEERKRLARELHDDLNQQVAALAIGISRVKLQLPDAGAGIQERLDTLLKETERLSDRIRKVSHELHSTVLQHVGFCAALTSLCAEFSSQEGIAVSLNIGRDVAAVPQEAALCLYRVAQESLRNVAKHSGARTAVVELAATDHVIELCIRDQGAGFDPGQAHTRRGLGLFSIEERVKLMGGTLVVTAGPRAGTELRVRIPLRTEQGQTESAAG